MQRPPLFHPAIKPSNGRSRRWIELRREFQVFRVRLECPDQRESEDEMRLLALILHSFSFTRQPELQFFNLERRNPADLLGGAFVHRQGEEVREHRPVGDSENLRLVSGPVRSVPGARKQAADRSEEKKSE